MVIVAAVQRSRCRLRRRTTLCWGRLHAGDGQRVVSARWEHHVAKSATSKTRGAGAAVRARRPRYLSLPEAADRPMDAPCQLGSSWEPQVAGARDIDTLVNQAELH